MKKLLALTLLVGMMLCFAGCPTPPPADQKGAPPAMTYIYNTNSGHQAIAEYVQAAFASAGITMNLTNQEWNTFLNTRKEGDYTIARNGWVADYTDPISFLDMWITESGNNDVQFGKGAHATLAMYNLDLTSLGYDINVQNGTWAQTYDVLISKIKAETDAAKRNTMMHMAEDMLMDTGCIMPVYYYTDLYMIDSDVNGFYTNALGYKYFMYTTRTGGEKTIAVCLASEPDTLDPALNSAVDGATMLIHLFAGLAKWQKNPTTGALEVVADQAESLPAGIINPDNTITYTYTLREGLKWSDGVELKASDFVYAWKRAAATATAADYGYMFDLIKGYGNDDVDGLAPLDVTADDAARTITVTINNAVTYWNELLAFPTYFPVRQDVVEGTYGDEGEKTWAVEAKTYVGNGPYKMTGWEHNSTITLTKNENYIDAANVTMDEIVCHLSDDANNMLLNFNNGTWQMIDDVPTAEIANLKQNNAAEFKIAGQIGTYYLCFNINESLLPTNSTLTGVEAEKANQQIRKALSLLLDRNYICESVAQGGQVPASSFVAMGFKNPDNTEFYQTAGDYAANGYYGYFNTAESAYAANCQAALAILQQYYTLTLPQ